MAKKQDASPYQAALSPKKGKLVRTTVFMEPLMEESTPLVEQDTAEVLRSTELNDKYSGTEGADKSVFESVTEGTVIEALNSVTEGTDKLVSHSASEGTEIEALNSATEGSDRLVSHSASEGTDTEASNSATEGTDTPVYDSDTKGTETEVLNSVTEGTDKLVFHSATEGTDTEASNSATEGTVRLVSHSASEGTDTEALDSVTEGTDRLVSHSDTEGASLDGDDIMCAIESKKIRKTYDCSSKYKYGQNLLYFSLYRYLKNEKELSTTISKIAEKFGSSSSGIKKILKRLAQAGMISLISQRGPKGGVKIIWIENKNPLKKEG